MDREEAIRQVGDWYGGFSDKPSEDAIHQAISDMAKLQKIENLYGIDKFGKVLTIEDRDREVQKILEES